METWWLALDRDYTSYLEVKHRKIVAQGWSSLGDLSTLCPLVQNNGNWNLFEQVTQELARLAYGVNSGQINRSPSVMWSLLKLEDKDLIVGIEGTAVKGICQLNQNGWESYKYDDSGAYEYAQTIGFPVEWVDWDANIFGFTPLPPNKMLGVKRLQNDSARVIGAWQAYQSP